MKKEKVCPVCQAFKDKKYIPEMILHIDKMIKSKQPTEILNKESGLIFTNYYYKKHREECLIDFEIPIEEQETKSNQDIEKKEKSCFQFMNVSSIIDDFRNMNDEEKQKQKFSKMLEIEYIIINIVHHQLLNGLGDNSIKGIIPKDDINSLKIINEVMRKNDVESEEMKKLFNLDSNSINEFIKELKIDDKK
jgi:hypothetical protein